MALTLCDFSTTFQYAPSPKTFLFTDITDYAAQGVGLAEVTGILKVTDPTGAIHYNNTNFSAPSGNRIAFGIVEFTGTAGGNVTAVSVNGVDQMDANEAAGGISTTLLATNVATNINGYTPSSGVDYSAISDAAIVSDCNTVAARIDIICSVISVPDSVPSTAAVLSSKKNLYPKASS